MAKEGDHLQFTYQGRQLEGILIQEKDGNATVKLDTGYNIIIPISDLKDAHITPAAKREQHAQKVAQNPTLPRVSILHTGGTIASKVDYATGGVLAQFEPEELIAMFPEMLQLANVSSRLVRNMWSDDMRFAHYNILARAVLEEINKGAAGVIITSGTDTLHYTAAAVSFAVEGLNIPVMVVGSQRSSDRGSSDASTNLMAAVRFITETRAPGVFIAMHERSDDTSIAIISGLHGRKNHSSRRDAFVTVNAPLVARVADGKVEILDAERLAQLKAVSKPKPQVMPFKEDLKVGLWKAHPQSFSEELLIYDHFDGLVVEGTGLGHLPINEIDEFTTEHTRIRQRIEQLARRIPVAVSTQTIFGRVNMNVYSPGRVLLGYGVLGQNCDMHPEVAFIKLAWLISNHPQQVRELYAKDLRGEISARSPLSDEHRE
jgi:glutamyl-tRNA(Gln) amidotransferase subunit D